MKKKLLLTLMSVAALAGCTLAPKYTRPEPAVAPVWPNGPAYAGNRFMTNLAADIGWRDFFPDARLQKLIGLALTNNRDLRIAVLNVEQARAQYRISRSALLPSVYANGEFIRQRIPGDVSFFGQPLRYDEYEVNLSSTSYEVDLFGRVRSLNHQALETFFATEEGRRSTQIALVSEVATQYFTLLQLDEDLALTRNTLAAVQSSYDLNKHSFDVGSSSELDLQISAAQVQTALANVAGYERQRAQAENALVLLLGQPLPENLPAGKKLTDENLPFDLPADLPSDMLRRRPDILQAEHTLKAANANIGAARAAFFPKVTLTGSAGYESLQLSHLFSGSQLAWSFSPEVSVPLFTGGLNKANLDVAKIGTQIDLAQYQKTIQTAFREVADSLTALSRLEHELKALELLVAAEQRRYDLADMRYRNGVESYLTVLTAQQDLYSAQQNLLQSVYDRLSNRVLLYQALGGGWNAESVRQQMASASNPSNREGQR